jgi:hypothetical protein
MIWIVYWLTLLALSTLMIYLAIDRLSHDELDEYNRTLKHNINQAEQESSSYETLPAYLKTKKTQSRIKHKPDL